MKYNKYVYYSLIMCAAIVWLTGCKSSKLLLPDKSESYYLSSKVQVTIPHKEAVFSVNGSMKLKKDELIQISFLMPIIRTEVARIEISPEEILLVDRMNHRFVRSSREELKSRLPKKWTYKRLEEIIYEASEPTGKKRISGEDFGLVQLQKASIELSDFSTEENGIKPTVLSSRYTEVTLEEIFQFLQSL